MHGAIGNLLDVVVGVVLTAGLAAVAWFFRQWAGSVSEKIDDLKDTVDGRFDAHDERVVQIEQNVDDARERIAYLAGAMGSPQTPPRHGVLSVADRHPDKGSRSYGQGGRRDPRG